MKLLLLAILSACSHIVTPEVEIEVIPVLGEPREVLTIQNKLKRDGCHFLKKIVAAPVENNKPLDDRLIAGLKERAEVVGAHVVVSNLKPQNRFNETYGLAYKCPHLEKQDDEE